MKKVIGYFSCDNGVPWTVWDADGEVTTNYHHNVDVKDGNVIEANADHSGEFVLKQYKLWESLVDLSIELECANLPAKVEGEMSLSEAVAESHLVVRDFKRYWIENNKAQPEYFPMSFEKEDAGSWFEQINNHEVGS